MVDALVITFVGVTSCCSALLALVLLGPEHQYVVKSLMLMLYITFNHRRRQDWIGRVCQYLLQEFPQHTGWMLQSVLGERMYTRFCSNLHYFLYEPNPILQYLYLTLVCGGYGAFVACAQPHIPNASVSGWHLYIIPCIVMATLYSFVLVCAHPPVRLTPRTYSTIIMPSIAANKLSSIL